MDELRDAVAVFEGDLEIRRVGGGRRLRGRFPYRTRATVRDRGRVRKESFAPRAFAYSLAQPERRIDLLVGHEFAKPIANRQSGTLILEDTADALTFEATLPSVPPSWVVDVELAIASGLMTGLSPGFSVPANSIVPGAETLEPEPGNPGVQVRVINHAVLRELSIVTSPAYEEAAVDLRAFGLPPTLPMPLRMVRRRWR